VDHTHFKNICMSQLVWLYPYL